MDDNLTFGALLLELLRAQNMSCEAYARALNDKGIKLTARSLQRYVREDTVPDLLTARRVLANLSYVMSMSDVELLLSTSRAHREKKIEKTIQEKIFADVFSKKGLMYDQSRIDTLIIEYTAEKFGVAMDSIDYLKFLIERDMNNE